MKTFLYIAFAVLGLAVVESYGPGGGGGGPGRGWGHHGPGGPWGHGGPGGPWGHGGPGGPWGHGGPGGPWGHEGRRGPWGHGGPGGPHRHKWEDSNEGPDSSNENSFEKFDPDDDWHKPHCKGSSCGRPEPTKPSPEPTKPPTKEPPITTYHPPYTSPTEPPPVTTEKPRPTRTAPSTNPTWPHYPDGHHPHEHSPHEGPQWSPGPIWPTKQPPTRPTIPTKEPPTTTETIPETTTDAEEEFTTLSPEIEKCIENCPSTPEFNPVCGTNGETYPNEGKLFCAKSCGVDVSLRRRSVCPPPTDDGGGITQGTTARPSPTPPFGRTTPFSEFQHCMKSCRITPTFQPVCGSDLVTYMNIDRLKCAQNCGQDVEVLCDKACISCGFVPKPTRPPTTVPPPTVPPPTVPPPTIPPPTIPPITPPTTQNPCGRKIPDPDVHKCIKNCPLTQEFNPVCGTNGVTFKNPGFLLCAQMCGIDVWAAKFAPCTDPTTSPPITPPTKPPTKPPTTFEPPPSTLPPHILTCIRNCPVTSEYDPVCGTDGLTYTNMGNLECAKYCGVAVRFRYKSRCSDEFDLRPSTPDIDGNKENNWKTEATTASPKVTQKWSTTLGFTIPPDVLDDIFGTKKPKTTKEPNHDDEDEDVDFDTRFGQPHSLSDSGHASEPVKPEKVKSEKGEADKDKPELDKSQSDKSDLDKSDQAKPEQAKPEQAKPEEDKSDKDKSDKDKSDKDKYDKDKPDQEKSDKDKPDQDKSDKAIGRSSSNITFPE